MLSSPRIAALTVLRRSAQPSSRGDFAAAFTTHFRWRYLAGQAAVEFGLAQDEAAISGTVDDCQQNRSITHADRAAFLGGNYEIVSVSPPDRTVGPGTITLLLKRRMGA